MNEKISSLKWAVGFSSFLFVIKGAVGVFCASQALLVSALDSLMDTGISFVNYLSALKGSKPADHDHAYGHEKIESLAAYTQGTVILVFSFLMFGEGIRRAFTGNIIFRSEIALVTITFAALINLILVGILHRAEQKTGSLILRAEKAHYLTDTFSYVSIIFALALVRFSGWSGWDIIAGIFLALYVASLAGQILKQAGDELVDRSLPKSVLDELDGLIQKHDPRVLGYHQLRTRKAGVKNFVDFHLVMKPNQSFEEAHEIAESLIKKIETRFKNVDVTIHEDPEGGI